MKALTEIQKELCNCLQCKVEFVARPFTDIGAALGLGEEEIIAEIGKLKELGIIRRIGASVNYRVLGRAGALVAACVPKEELAEVVKAVNALEGVSHNYMRRHEYNLWFTLQAADEPEVEKILSTLSGRFGIDFHVLPAIQTFKLDVRFDAFSSGTRLLPADAAVEVVTATIGLDDEQMAVLKALGRGIEITARPFAMPGFDETRLLEVARNLQRIGVIRRFAAVVDYRKLGFNANAMLVCEVEQERIKPVGAALAGLDCVSHCYQRRTFEGWPYNLFGMMHGPDLKTLQQKAAAFAKANKLNRYELLETAEEFKKQPVVPEQKTENKK